MTDIYGKKATNGMQVTYADVWGDLRPATIKKLHPPIYKADLEVTMPDGDTKFVEGALFNLGPAAHCWTHRPEEGEQGAPVEGGSADAGEEERSADAGEEERSAETTEAEQPVEEAKPARRKKA